MGASGQEVRQREQDIPYRSKERSAEAWGVGRKMHGGSENTELRRSVGDSGLGGTWRWKLTSSSSGALRCWGLGARRVWRPGHC